MASLKRPLVHTRDYDDSLSADGSDLSPEANKMISHQQHQPVAVRLDDMLPEEFDASLYAGHHTEIGRGTYGRVLSLLGTGLAVKVLESLDERGRVDMGAHDSASFECAVTLKLCAAGGELMPHPNLVTVHHVFTVQLRNMHFIVMDNCLGGTLRSRIVERRGMPAPTDVWSVAQQLLSALSYCHAQSVVHCDVKSHNIMFKADGTLQLLDFSNARYVSSVDNSGGTGSIVFALGDPSIAPGSGTGLAGLGSGGDDDNICSPESRPPEASLRSLAICSGGSRCRGLDIDSVAQCTSAIDIWSAGCVLFEYLTDHVPFNGNCNRQLICSIVRRLGMPSEENSPARSAASWPQLQSYVVNVLAVVRPSELPQCQKGPSSVDSLWTAVAKRSHDVHLRQLLEQMICWDPRRRCTAKAALFVCESSLSINSCY